jgi:hypothetical protein
MPMQAKLIIVMLLTFVGCGSDNWLAGPPPKPTPPPPPRFTPEKIIAHLKSKGFSGEYHIGPDLVGAETAYLKDDKTHFYFWLYRFPRVNQAADYVKTIESETEDEAFINGSNLLRVIWADEQQRAKLLAAFNEFQATEAPD